MGKNLDSLGAEFDGRMKAVFRASYPSFTTDLGKITSNGGLQLDSMKGNIIPKGSYMVNVYFLKEQALKSGDRVLVTWVGKEPIVVAVVTSS